MIRVGRKHEFIALLNNLNSDAELSIRHQLSTHLPQTAIRIVSLPSNVSYFRNNKTHISASELLREDYIKHLRPDILHVSSLFEGLQDDIVTSVKKFHDTIKTSVTLYDLIPWVFRDSYLQNKTTLEHYRNKLTQLGRADLLLSISAYSKQEAHDVLDLPQDRIVNISSAADDKFRPIEVSSDRRARLCKKYNTCKPFLLYISSFDQRKNQSRLIQAFADLPEQLRSTHQLLIVGNGSDAVFSDLKATALNCGLTLDDILFTGHIDDEDVVDLYNTCALFIFPSLAEGFGLPVLEAMSCGAPTICSNTTSLPEVVGRPHATFDPQNKSSITRKIAEVLTSHRLRQQLVDEGLIQARNFAWDSSAAKALEAMVSLEEPKHTTVLDFSAASFADKVIGLQGIQSFSHKALRSICSHYVMNVNAMATFSQISMPTINPIAIVTTWNSCCGIAEYSQQLFAGNANFLILAPENEKRITNDAEHVVRCWSLRGELSGILDVVTRTSASNVIIQFNYGFFQLEALAQLIDSLANVQRSITIIFHSTTDPSPSHRLRSICTSLQKCKSLVVHTLKDAQRLSDLGLSCNLHLIPLAIQPEHHPRESQRPRRRMISTFGFALPHKGLLETIDGIKILNSDPVYGGSYSLRMLNSEHPDPSSHRLLEHIRQRISDEGLQYISLDSAYKKEEECLRILQESDLVVFPYTNTGESSSAAVRMALRSGVDVAVSESPIFDDIRDLVWTIPNSGPELLASRIHSIITNPRSTRSQIRKRLFFSSLSSSNVLQQILFLNNVARLELEHAAPPLMDYDINASSPQMSLTADDSCIKTIVGSRQPGRIFTTSNAGNLLHGPYISIGPGKYSVTMMGTTPVLPDNCPMLEVVYNNGSEILATSALQQRAVSEATPIASCEFVIPATGCLDLEFRVNVSAADIVSFDHFKISPFASK
jgi:glycosyltransferase involved in cell wall biosynthesis